MDTPTTELEFFTKNINEPRMIHNKMSSLAPSTIKTYLNKYKNLRKQVDTDLNEISQPDILEILEGLKVPSINTYNSLLNLFIMIKQMYSLPYDLLINQRDSNAPKIAEFTADKFAKNDLPSYETLIADRDDKLNKLQFREYIITYLLIEYGVRNKDMDIKLAGLKREMNTTENWFWVRPRGGITYIINDYKTASTYGTKTIQINDPIFNRAVRTLFRTGERKLIPVNDFANFIQKSTYNSVGEVVYYKTLIKHYWNDKKRLQELSASRGTSFNTMLSHYKE